MSRRSRFLAALLTIGLILALVAAWDLIVLFAPFPAGHRTGPPMLIVAHRGNMEAFPEDTAEAIWDAARLHADGIEFDVHQSSSGTWWVMHDPTVDRTTDGSGRIRELSDDAMDRLRIDSGPGFDADANPVIKPPRLARVLEGLAGYQGEIFIDLQHATGADVTDLLRQLGASDLDARLTIICRSEADVQAVQATSDEISAIIRPNRVADGSAADGYLLESLHELSADAVAQLSGPVTTYNEERYVFLGEERLLRRAWSVGARAFLAKRLTEAIAIRDALQREGN